jgi:hypothetical protein
MGKNGLSSPLLTALREAEILPHRSKRCAIVYTGLQDWFMKIDTHYQTLDWFSGRSPAHFMSRARTRRADKSVQRTKPFIRISLPSLVARHAEIKTKASRRATGFCIRLDVQRPAGGDSAPFSYRDIQPGSTGGAAQ